MTDQKALTQDEVFELREERMKLIFLLKEETHPTIRKEIIEFFQWISSQLGMPIPDGLENIGIQKGDFPRLVS